MPAKKRFLLIWLIVLLLFAGCSNADHPSDLPELTEEVTDSGAAAAPSSDTVRPDPSEPAAVSPVAISAEPTPAPGLDTPPPGEPPEPTPSSKPTAQAPETAAPYSAKNADTLLTVSGSGVTRDYYFTLGELMALTDGFFEADYFSRGKDPQEETNHFKGIRLDYLLGKTVPLTEDAKKASIISSDGYAVGYSLGQISAAYLDETDLSKALYMILAWEQDSESLGSLCLVMGQSIEGEYNRTYWVRDVITIEVKAG